MEFVGTKQTGTSSERAQPGLARASKSASNDGFAPEVVALVSFPENPSKPINKLQQSSNVRSGANRRLGAISSPSSNMQPRPIAEKIVTDSDRQGPYQSKECYNLKTLQRAILFFGGLIVLTSLCMMVPRLHGGDSTRQPGGLNHRVPPYWSPENEYTYSFRA